jgi:ABC-type sugar transport system ATPase subunit
MDASPLLRVRAASRSYGGERALDDVSLALGAGAVLALVGENGAGKSTLLNCVCGVVSPDRGTVELDGEPIRPGRAHDALVRGIATVHQELTLFPHLQVWENVFAGHERAGGVSRRLRRAEMVSRTRELLERLGADVAPEARVDRLALAEQAQVEIAKALSWEPRLLILDEATSALDQHQVERLFALVRELAGAGAGVVFVSHRLREVLELCDSALVLKDGRCARELETLAGVTEAELVEAMVGRPLEAIFPPKPAPARERAALAVEHLAGGAVRDVSLLARPGEIVGLGGLQGHGQQDVLRMIFGAAPRRSGTVAVRGVPLRAASPRRAMAAGLAYVPPDRKTEGLLLGHSVESNLTITLLDRIARGPLGLLDTAAEREVLDGLRGGLRIVQRRWRQAIESLSGGNQQKVVLGKWLGRDVDVLLLDEPTRGVDVGTKSEVYRLLRELADAGKAIVVASTDSLELLGLCDRIVVLYEGRVQRELAGGAVNEYELTEATLGVAAHGGGR